MISTEDGARRTRPSRPVKPRILVIPAGLSRLHSHAPGHRSAPGEFSRRGTRNSRYDHIVALAHRRFTGCHSLHRVWPHGRLSSCRTCAGRDLADYSASFQQTALSYLSTPTNSSEGTCGARGKELSAAYVKIDDSQHAASNCPTLEQFGPLSRGTAARFIPRRLMRLSPRVAGRKHAAGDPIHPGSGSARKNWPRELGCARTADQPRTRPRLLLVGGKRTPARDRAHGRVSQADLLMAHISRSHTWRDPPVLPALPWATTVDLPSRAAVERPVSCSFGPRTRPCGRRPSAGIGRHGGGLQSRQSAVTRVQEAIQPKM